MEYLDGRAKEDHAPFKYYAFDLRIPYYIQPKTQRRHAVWDDDKDEGEEDDEEEEDPTAMTPNLMLPFLVSICK